MLRVSKGAGMGSTDIGMRGESAAAAYLERMGMEILERNWRTERGEIDIIALDGEELVICEVKTRRSTSAGTPEEAVSASKQRRLARLAQGYISSTGLADCAVRFDVVSVAVISDDRALLRHHRAAFVA
ncbi:MAG TPA: YraN family protein [Coriobacteriia bacterium]|nr:YraN family protein [Coriobacteriia bacterium]